MQDNFALFEKYPDYVFSFEGAFRYMLMREYYPQEYARVKQAIADGRWRVAGSWVDAVDTNMPSPESLIRHALYGNGFFRREFGKTSCDIFLPDCFGFGYALPVDRRPLRHHRLLDPEAHLGIGRRRAVRHRPLGGSRRLDARGRAQPGRVRVTYQERSIRRLDRRRDRDEAGRERPGSTRHSSTSAPATRAAPPPRSRCSGSRRASTEPARSRCAAWHPTSSPATS